MLYYDFIIALGLRSTLDHLFLIQNITIGQL